jgi:hypothetical protein
MKKEYRVYGYAGTQKDFYTRKEAQKYVEQDPESRVLIRISSKLKKVS